MISETFIEHWHTQAKWQTLPMVEQDLVISRALICLYNVPKIRENLVFRGGTALNKLYLKPAMRYSEDLDFVQQKSEPIGDTMDAIREALKEWLGEPKRKITERSAKLMYQYTSVHGFPSRLKIEINTTEHFQVQPLISMPFAIDSPWFKGTCDLYTYSLEELMATKLRALYQRRKGRDLFDLWWVFSQNLADTNKTIEIFKRYCKKDGNTITKELFQKNMELKRLNKDFQIDMQVLLPHQASWSFDVAFEFVQANIIDRINLIT